MVLLIGCGSGSEGDKRADRNASDESERFANVVGGGSFVGDESCFDCHEDQYVGYQSHGMASSYYPLTPDNAVEDYSDVEIYHAESDLYYRVFRENGRFYQEEVRRDADGRVVHRLRREMEYVVGSGSAARTYLTEENGRYYEMPMTWYSQAGRWDFSPGYEERNSRFERLIPDRCMTCHNDYPEPIEHAEGKYGDVPNGIGCERCHGPGSIHVDARLAAPEPVGEIDTTIVNPRHLSLDRRLDVCQQCHLHTTVSVLREGRTAYDFRPSQALAEYVSFHASDRENSEEEISVISHADRMQRSPCFIETQDLESAMDCMTCHDPHEGFRDAGPDYFNRTCRSCHETSSLRDRFQIQQTRAVHTPESNCYSCHMPKVEAEGTPHASFTDHWIRVVDEQPDAPPSAENASVRLEPYFTRDEDADVYRGVAYVIYGRQSGDSSALHTGINTLEEHLDEEVSFGEAYFLLGFAHLQLGNFEEAIPPLERAVTIDSAVPERLNALAQAYEAEGRSAESIERLYRRALGIQPALADVRVNLGRFLESRGRLDEAVEQYQAAVKEQPSLEEGHYNLGTAYLRSGDLENAENALRAAVQLAPDHVDALGNLGLLLANSGRNEAARHAFQRALQAEPENPVAMGNLGAFYLNSGNLADAVRLLERAVEYDPRFVDGLVNLALAHYNLGNPENARRYAEQALRLAPDNPTARELLNALSS